MNTSTAPLEIREKVGAIMSGTTTNDDAWFYAHGGPVDGEEGHKYLLQNRPAVHSVEDSAEAGSCYAKTDGKLKICFGAINE
jgi:hypothetical protein